MLTEAALAQFLEQLIELLAQRLLLVAQVAHALLALLPRLALILLLARLVLLPLLTLLAFLAALALLAALVLALLEGAVAQLLLPADHVAELVERLVHLVVAVVALLARPRHLQVVEHLRELIEHLARGVARPGARHLLHAVEHALEILRAELARIRIERTLRLIRIALHLFRERLQEAIDRRPQLVHQLLDLFLAGAALERLAQRFLRRPQRLLGIRHVAVLERDRHVPHARDHVAQLVVALGARQLIEDRAQAEIDAWISILNFSGAQVSASSAVSTSACASPSSARLRRCSISERATGLVNARSGSRKSIGSVVPSLPPSSRAISVIDTSAPAQGCSLMFLVVRPTPLRVRACGSDSVNSGAS